MVFQQDLVLTDKPTVFKKKKKEFQNGYSFPISPSSLGLIKC